MRCAGAILAVIVAGTAVPARAQPAPDCREVLPHETAERFFEALRDLSADDGCVLRSVDTRGPVTEITWVRDGGALPAARALPRACAPTGAVVGEQLALEGPEALRAACPATWEAAVGVVRARRFGRVETVEPGGAPIAPVVVRTASRTALALASIAVVAFAFLSVRRHPPDGRSVGMGLALFAAALGVRLAIEPAPANWYTEVLPAEGPTIGRFGYGGLALQEALRSALPWSDRVLFLATSVLGAAAAPLTLLLCRQRRLSPAASTVAGVLVAFAPLAVRASASASPHVLSSTATLAACCVWLSGARRGDAGAPLVAFLLVALATLTRADAWAQAAVVPLWGLLADPGLEPRAAGRRRWLPAGLFYAGWLALGALTWHFVVREASHPGPTWDAVGRVARELVSQYHVAFEPPFWVSPVAVVLFAVGVVGAGLRRPALVATAILALAACFVPLGRNLVHDELLGGRYFLITIPFLAVGSALGVEVIERLLARVPRLGERATSPMLVALVAAAAVGFALPAWGVRYAFQDEHALLRSELGALPGGCVVLQVPVRHRVLEQDLDCCLDAPRSPLVAAYPELDLRYLDLDAPLRSVPPPEQASCVAYYESAACSIRDTTEVRSRWPAGRRVLAEACRAAAARHPQRVLRETAVSPRSTFDVFGGRTPHVGLRLWRW